MAISPLVLNSSPGDEAADDYNHMQHLSVAAEIVAKEEE